MTSCLPRFLTYGIELLLSFSHYYYVGSTQDLDSRLERHNQGRSRYTKAKGPWELIYWEDYPDRGSAVKRESEIKRHKRRGHIERLVESQGSG
ncbi:MAG: GIY-YIG nuclease family protein [Deltaproteobacteria bacterium]|nr:GIY-YIG nuclease family protein [Deltaproteobacteria bacterium]